jgi:hypothetical protein
MNVAKWRYWAVALLILIGMFLVGGTFAWLLTEVRVRNDLVEQIRHASAADQAAP